MDIAKQAPIDIAEYKAWLLACALAGITSDIKNIAAR